MDSSVFLDFLGKRKPPSFAPLLQQEGGFLGAMVGRSNTRPSPGELSLTEGLARSSSSIPKENQPLTRAVSRGGWCLSSVRVNPNGVKEYVWRLSSILSLRFQVVLRHPGEVDSAVFSEEIAGVVVREDQLLTLGELRDNHDGSTLAQSHPVPCCGGPDPLTEAKSQLLGVPEPFSTPRIARFEVRAVAGGISWITTGINQHGTVALLKPLHVPILMDFRPQ